MSFTPETPESGQPKPKRGLFRHRENHEPEQAPEETTQSTPEQDAEVCTNPNCIIHGTNGMFALPPFAAPVGRGLSGLVNAIEQAKKQAADKVAASPNRPQPAAREWTPMFADEVNEGDLLGVPSGTFGPGERELKVCKIRHHRGNDEDPLAPYRTLLMVDTGSGEVFSPTVSAQQGFRVAPAVPDSPEFLGGGA